MKKNAVISISGTQCFGDEAPETIELTTQGSYDYEPGRVIISYVETQMTGLEGVETVFAIEDEEKVTLTRSGKINSEMRFMLNQKHDSLYDMGFATLLLSVTARRITVLLNEKGGIFDLEYDVSLEQTACGTNGYHISVRVLEDET